MRDKRRLANLACVVCGKRHRHRLQFRCIGQGVFVCRACHRKFRAAKYKHPKPIWTPPDELERIGRALLAEADLFEMLLNTRRKFGHALIERSRVGALGNGEDDGDDPNGRG